MSDYGDFYPLKPCPICGAAAEKRKHTFDTGDAVYFVRCENRDCLLRDGGSVWPLPELAVGAWNKRPIEDAQAAEIARLRAVLVKFANSDNWGYAETGPFGSTDPVWYGDGEPCEIAQAALAEQAGKE